MRMDNALIPIGSKLSLDLAKIPAIKSSNLLVANKIMATIKQKENDFLGYQNFNNIKNRSSKNIQNNGLRKEKRNWLKLLRPDKKIAFNASIFILISLSLFFAFFFCLL